MIPFLRSSNNFSQNLSNIATMAKTLLIIGLGGFLGSVTRYTIYHYFSQSIQTDFPWGTFVANLIGCLMIGVIFGWISNGNSLDRNLVFFLSVGFCGALTTFSTFSYENVLMLQRGKVLLLIFYSGLSYTLGLLMTWLGLSLPRLL